jgi:hypothetical protein
MALDSRNLELAARFGASQYWTAAEPPTGTYDAVGILGASAGLATAIEHYADGRVVPGDLVEVVVGLDDAVEALASRLDPAPGVKIHIDPRL